MAAPPPPIPDELVEEILLRLPPDEPACLLRASIVCKDWAGMVSRPAFRRRLHELHPTPPVLGFLPGRCYVPQRNFIPTIASSFSPAAPDHRFWHALDCRHGRALFVLSQSRGQDTRYARELLVWEPITGAQQRVPWPAAYPSVYPTMAAVLCAADGCDHRDCLGGPFHLLIVFDDEHTGDNYLFVPVISVCVYSSETGAWGEPLTSNLAFSITESSFSSVLLGRSLLYFLFYDSFDDDGYRNVSIVEYDLSRHALTVFSFDPPNDNYCDCQLVLAEDGGLGVIQDSDPRLKLWTRDVSDARWLLTRVIHLGNLLPTSARLFEHLRVYVMGFAEGANAIFVNTIDGIFTIELQTEHVSKVCSDHDISLIPVVSFYTPLLRCKPGNKEPNEEAGGEEAGEEEKTVDRTQRLLSKGSNAIKEGDFVNTFECVSNDHNIRVPCYGEGASMLNKHGCALLPKDSSGDITMSAPNEESVKGTTSKDEAVNSVTSYSNVEGAPASEKERILKQQQEDEERRLQHKAKKGAKKKGQVVDIDP